jgi:hypothetical protein
MLHPVSSEPKVPGYIKIAGHVTRGMNVVKNGMPLAENRYPASDRRNLNKNH